MISNSGVSSILKSSVHNTESTFSGGPSMVSSQFDPRKTQNVSRKGSFESLSSPDLKLSNKCCVCLKGFTLKIKHICEFCNNAVCADHSLRTRVKNGTAKRICDICEQEKAKEDIKQEIQNEFSKLEGSIQASNNAIERLNREYFEKTSILNDAEKKLAGAEATHEKTMRDLKNELEILGKNLEKARQQLMSSKKALSDSKENEEEMIRKFEKGEKDIKFLDENSVKLKKERSEMTNEIELLNNSLKNSILFESISKSLCGRCAGRLGESYDKIKEMSYWLQEPEDR